MMACAAREAAAKARASAAVVSHFVEQTTTSVHSTPLDVVSPSWSAILDCRRAMAVWRRWRASPTAIGRRRHQYAALIAMRTTRSRALLMWWERSIAKALRLRAACVHCAKSHAMQALAQWKHLEPSRRFQRQRTRHECGPAWNEYTKAVPRVQRLQALRRWRLAADAQRPVTLLRVYAKAVPRAQRLQALRRWRLAADAQRPATLLRVYAKAVPRVQRLQALRRWRLAAEAQRPATLLRVYAKAVPRGQRLQALRRWQRVTDENQRETLRCAQVNALRLARGMGSWHERTHQQRHLRRRTGSRMRTNHGVQETSMADCLARWRAGAEIALSLSRRSVHHRVLVLWRALHSAFHNWCGSALYAIFLLRRSIQATLLRRHLRLQSTFGTWRVAGVTSALSHHGLVALQRACSHLFLARAQRWLHDAFALWRACFARASLLSSVCASVARLHHRHLLAARFATWQQLDPSWVHRTICFRTWKARTTDRVRLVQWVRSQHRLATICAVNHWWDWYVARLRFRRRSTETLRDLLWL